MQLTVNGEGRELPDGATVAALVARLGLAERKVAVERNLMGDRQPRSSVRSGAT